MAVGRSSVMFDVLDFKVYPMITDGSGASAPTYGSGIDVPGISAVSLEPNVVTNEIKGDSTVIAKRGRVDKVTVSATYSKISMDVLASIVGGVVEATPSANDLRYRFTSGATLNYFGAAIRVSDLDLGIDDCHFYVYKCQLNSASLLDQSSDEFGTQSFELDGITTEAHPVGGIGGYMYDIVFFENSTALPVTLTV